MYDQLGANTLETTFKTYIQQKRELNPEITHLEFIFSDGIPPIVSDPPLMFLSKMLEEDGANRMLVSAASELYSNPSNLSAFDESIVHQLNLLLERRMYDLEYSDNFLSYFFSKVAVGCNAIHSSGFLPCILQEFDMDFRIKLLQIKHYATTKSWENATDEQQSVGDTTSNRDASVNRLWHVLGVVAQDHHKWLEYDEIVRNTTTVDISPICFKTTDWTGYDSYDSKVSVVSAN
jgi:hypothetical protein